MEKLTQSLPASQCNRGSIIKPFRCQIPRTFECIMPTQGPNKDKLILGTFCRCLMKNQELSWKTMQTVVRLGVWSHRDCCKVRSWILEFPSTTPPQNPWVRWSSGCQRVSVYGEQLPVHHQDVSSSRAEVWCSYQATLADSELQKMSMEEMNGGFTRLHISLVLSMRKVRGINRKPSTV